MSQQILNVHNTSTTVPESLPDYLKIINSNFTDLYNFAPGVLYNVKLYGAIGNGVSHPLSSLYGSLANAQVVYPKALSLTEEIDFNAIRRVIDVAIAAGGGTVYIPYGRYMMNNATHTGTIQIPECTPFGTPGVQINFLGDGWRNSVLKWPNDYGLNGNTFAMICGDPTGTFANSLGRYASLGTYEGFCQDLQLEGPVVTVTAGVKNCNLSGFGWGARRRMVRCQILGFYAGVDIVGDWAEFNSVYAANCYYGLYFNRFSPALFGDLIFNKCLFTPCAMAAIAMHPIGYIGAIFNGCFIGGSPYSIMMEAGTGAGGLNMTTTQFNKCQFENVGNGLIVDENGLNAGTKIMQLDRVSFNECTVFMDVTKLITTGGRGNSSLVSVSVARDITFKSTYTPPGSALVFDVDFTQGILLNGELDALMGNLSSTVSLTNSANGYGSIRLQDNYTGFGGHVEQVGAGGAVARYDLLEAFFGRAVQCGVTVAAILGVAQHACSANGFVVVATRGASGAGVTVKATGILTGNTWVKKAATGAVTVATGPTDGLVVGYVVSFDSGNTRYGIQLGGGNFAGNI